MASPTGCRGRRVMMHDDARRWTGIIYYCRRRRRRRRLRDLEEASTRVRMGGRIFNGDRHCPGRPRTSAGTMGRRRRLLAMYDARLRAALGGHDRALPRCHSVTAPFFLLTRVYLLVTPGRADALQICGLRAPPGHAMPSVHGGGFVHKVKLARWGQKTNVWVERKVLRKGPRAGDEGRGGRRRRSSSSSTPNDISE